MDVAYDCSMKEGKYKKTAQESSSAARGSSRNNQKSITERLENTTCIGNVAGTLLTDATHVEYQQSHVIAA